MSLINFLFIQIDILIIYKTHIFKCLNIKKTTNPRQVTQINRFMNPTAQKLALGRKKGLFMTMKTNSFTFLEIINQRVAKDFHEFQILGS